jgi:hypothetical protein
MQDQPRLGAHHPVELRHEFGGLLHVFQHIAREHHVEGALFEGKRRQVRQMDPLDPRLRQQFRLCLRHRHTAPDAAPAAARVLHRGAEGVVARHLQHLLPTHLVQQTHHPRQQPPAQGGTQKDLHPQLDEFRMDWVL